MGTTIIELLIYMALLVIFLTVLMDVFVTTLDFKLQTESVSALNQDTRYILAKISYDVYNAKTFTVTAGGQELDLTNYNGTINRYTVSGGDILLNSVKLNGLDTKVGSISFTKIGATVQVTLNMQSQIITQGNQQKTQDVQVTLGTRYEP